MARVGADDRTFVPARPKVDRPLEYGNVVSVACDDCPVLHDIDGDIVTMTRSRYRRAGQGHVIGWKGVRARNRRAETGRTGRPVRCSDVLHQGTLSYSS